MFYGKRINGKNMIFISVLGEWMPLPQREMITNPNYRLFR